MMMAKLLLLLLSRFSHVWLWDPIDGSPPGSPVPGILQARTLEWVAISFSNSWKRKVKVKSLTSQSCPTLYDPMDCSQPGSSVHGILQARILEWIVIPFSRESTQELNWVLLHCRTEKAMAPHSSTVAWKIPWVEEPGWLQSMGSRRVGHDWATSLLTFHFHALEKEMATHSSVLAWRIPGMGEPGGLPSMGSHRVGHDWSDLAAAAVSHLAYYPQGSSMLSQMQDFLLLYGWILFQCIKSTKFCCCCF